jgi:hypothetical protein
MAATAIRQSGKAPTVSQLFDFESKLFQIEGAYFALGSDRRVAAYYVRIGDLEAALSLRTLPKAFDLSEHDCKLLELISGSLRYVREIRPGDSIPNEILNGTASWTVDEEHRVIARNRLTVSVAFWASGRKADMPTAEQCAELVRDERITATFAEGSKKLAEQMAGADGEAAVARRLSVLCGEFAYIEALRERYQRVFRVAHVVGRLANHFRQDAAVVQTIARVNSLMARPISRFRTVFSELDQGVSEPTVSLIKRFDQTVQLIRTYRDELHTSLFLWEPLSERCDQLVIERSPECEALVKDVYGLLASEYPSVQSWR